MVNLKVHSKPRVRKPKRRIGGIIKIEASWPKNQWFNYQDQAQSLANLEVQRATTRQNRRSRKGRGGEATPVHFN